MPSWPLAFNLASLAATLSFAACFGIFLWASGKGFDVTDDATHILWAADPFSYHISLSQYGFLWHPVYLLVRGKIAAFRVAGLFILVLCGTLFGHGLWRFLGSRSGSAGNVLMATAAICVCLFWQFEQWAPSPGYDQLNLGGLLLLFAGLLAVPRVSRDASRGGMIVSTVGWSALGGVALGIIALTKPTTCVAAVALTLVWIALLPPQRPWLCLSIGTLSALATVAVAVGLIDGNPDAFFSRNLAAYEFMRARDSTTDVHSIARSIVHPFLVSIWARIVPTLAGGAFAFALSFAALVAATASRPHSRLQTWFPLPLAAMLAAFVGYNRAVDFGAAGGWPGSRVWYLSLPLVLCAVALAVFRRNAAVIANHHRTILAAGLLALAPAAYSFGTDNTILFHMSGAGVFWAASAILLACLAEDGTRDRLLGAVAVLYSFATVGMLAGMLPTPGRVGTPLWSQTVPIALGSDDSLSVDPATATYFLTLQAAARRHGLPARTPIVELSGTGPGIVLALDGKPLGIPWLLAGGPNPEASARIALAQVPLGELKRAWIITGGPDRLAHARIVMQSLGRSFPEMYEKVGAARYPAAGWTQTIWKPAADNWRAGNE